MKLFYLSRIVRTPLQMDPDDPNSVTLATQHRFQVLCETLGLNITYQGGEIRSNPDGSPAEKALLILVDHPDHSVFVADPDMAVFPDAGLSTKLNAISIAERTAFRLKAMAMGYTQAEVDAVWANTDMTTLRQVVTHYGRMNNLDFDTYAFDLVQ